MNRVKLYKNYLLLDDIALKQNHFSVDELIKIEISSSSKTYTKTPLKLLVDLVGLELMGGQSLKKTRSKKSVANFNLIKNTRLGCQVTLTNKRLYQFLEKNTTFILPGTSKNITKIHYGVDSIFALPEFQEKYELLEIVHGFTINMITSARDKKDITLLLTGLGIPII